MGGALAVCIFFLIRQRSQLQKLQNKLVDETPHVSNSEEAISSNLRTKREIQITGISAADEFSENLQIIKDLQSKMDGLTVEMKIRGEMIIERDNRIAELEKELQTLEAQIAIFKNQIAPALEATITELRNEQDQLQDSIEHQSAELKSREARINATHKILQKAGMGNLIEIEELQVELDKKDRITARQNENIKNLQSQVDQLPLICLQMTNEIKKRESEVNSLKSYNNVLNRKLKLAQEELSKITNKGDSNLQELTKRLMELQELFEKESEKNTLLDKEILMLNSLVMEKESKIAKLEERLRKLVFSRPP
jgi:chromosome segregation ATPase